MINIFVFGSNLAGRHGKGAALFALKNHGAKYGQGFGLQGNSYAIPTKDRKLSTLSLSLIGHYVDLFKEFAEQNQKYEFQLTPIGCGLAGYKYHQIGPLFKNSSKNIIIPQEFREYV